MIPPKHTTPASTRGAWSFSPLSLTSRVSLMIPVSLVKLVSLIPLVGLMFCLSHHAAAQGSRSQGRITPSPADVAIILGPDLHPAIRVTQALTGSSISGSSFQLVSPAWYEQVQRAFERTSVGEALSMETDREDWTLVSMRIAPCTPWVNSPADRPEFWCWPEVRGVVQPLYDFSPVGRRRVDHYGDDRALHLLYDAYLGLSQGEIRWIKDFKAQFTRRYEARGDNRGVQDWQSISSESRQTFNRLRDQVLQTLEQRLFALRQLNGQDTYARLAERPELYDGRAEQQRQFRRALIDFLHSYARPENLSTLTAFSLPEGREPALLDEWVFLKFTAQQGRLTLVPIPVFDPQNGKKLFSLEVFESASQQRDDARFYDLIDERPGLWGKLRNLGLFYAPDRVDFAARINDPAQTLVPNTTCASCHKFNEPSFNFHNLSMLEDRFITISERVKQDVAFDLAWWKSWIAQRR